MGRKQLTTSPAGINLIKQFEGCELKAYRCQAGVLTIGYGHTGDDIKEGQTITQDEAEELLKQDLRKFEDGVWKYVWGTPLKQHQFDALVSFAFNVGLENLRHSTLARKLNEGNHSLKSIAGEFLKWNKVRQDGQLVASNGLTRRRQAEKAMFEGKEVVA